MPKHTVSDILASGFTKEMFHKDTDTALESMVTSIIDEQSGFLLAEVGATTYNTTNAKKKAYVTRAEKCSIMRELLNIRINYRLGTTGVDLDLEEEKAQRDAYDKEYQSLIFRLKYADIPAGMQ